VFESIFTFHVGLSTSDATIVRGLRHNPTPPLPDDFRMEVTVAMRNINAMFIAALSLIWKEAGTT
jgi:hypothetical protein